MTNETKEIIETENTTNNSLEVGVSTLEETQEDSKEEETNVKKNITSALIEETTRKRLVFSPYPDNVDKLKAVMNEQREYLVKVGYVTEKEQMSVIASKAFSMLYAYEEIADIIGIDKLNEILNKPIEKKPNLVF